MKIRTNVLCLLFVALSSFAAEAALQSGPNAIDFNAQGCPRELRVGTTVLANDCSQGVGEVLLGGRAYRLDNPASQTSTTASFGVAYQLPTQPALLVGIGYSITERSGVPVLARHVSVRRNDGKKALPADLTIRLSYGPATPHASGVWVPHRNGTGPKIDFASTEVVYRAAGRANSSGVALAIPLYVGALGNSASEMVAFFTDPDFSTVFDRTSVRWTYPKEVGLEDGTERRTLFTALLQPKSDLHALTDGAIRLFYSSALPDVPAGPAWLKQISMVTYDYMSDGGTGWKNDIDVLTAKVAPEFRHKIMLTLHGWFDLNGRFSYAPGAARLDESWPSFRPSVGQLTVADVRARINYAKDRGFRVGIYYGNGMNSASHQRVEIARDPDHILRRLKNGWAGPDMAGTQAVILNPLHPAVFNHFVNLANAELEAWGDLIDAYVWDETFYVEAGDLGTARVPGYADRAFMRLTKAIAKTIHRRYPDAAFLTSDDISAKNNVPPYALFADGTYQDASVNPAMFSYAIFPNYRNTVFSCNWFTKRNHRQMEFGVRNYQAPVVITNGWADDYGISEMTTDEQAKHLQLFQWRSAFDTRLQWFDQLPIFTE